MRRIIDALFPSETHAEAAPVTEETERIPIDKVFLLQKEDVEIFSGEVLGIGGFTTVKTGRMLRDSEKGEKCAVKCFERDVELAGEQLEVFRAEVECLSAISAAGGHASVLSWFGLCQGPNSNFIALEYCSGGNLKEQLVIFGEELTFGAVINYYQQMASAIAFLHSIHYIWRDCKCANVLFASRDTIKIADFGLAKHKTDTVRKPDRKLSLVEVSMACGTRQWMAPEMEEMSYYDERIDTFAFGVSLLECLYRPISSLTFKTTYLWRGQLCTVVAIPPTCPEPLRELVLKLMHVNPEKRPMMDQLGPMLEELNAAIADQHLPETPDVESPDTESNVQPIILDDSGKASK